MKKVVFFLVSVALILSSCVPDINEPVNDSNIKGTKWYAENIGPDSLYVYITFKSNEKRKSENNRVVFEVGVPGTDLHKKTSGWFSWHLEWSDENQVIGHTIIFWEGDLLDLDHPYAFLYTKYRYYDGKKIPYDFHEISFSNMYIEEQNNPNIATLVLYDDCEENGAEIITTDIVRIK